MMREGKISKAVWDRAVSRPLKQQSVCGPDIAQGQGSAGLPEALSACAGSRSRMMVSVSTGSIGGALDRTAQMIICEAVNNLAVSGAKCSGIVTALVLPSACGEEELRNMMQQIAQLARMLDIPVLGGDTKVSGEVTHAVLTVNAFGCRPDTVHPAGDKWDLLMTGYAGWAGTGILAGAYAQRIRERFPSFMEENALAMMQPEYLLVTKAADIAAAHGSVLMEDVSTGGVLGALWEFCQREALGMEIDMRAIPVRQETIEICELCGRNPYELFGQGALLIACRDGAALLQKLRRSGIDGALLGSCCSEKISRSRVLRNGEEIRYLNKPQPDALWNEV